MIDQKQIDFIQKRWAGRPNGSDVQELIDEIARLSDIIESQADIIEDRILDEMGNQPD